MAQEIRRWRRQSRQFPAMAATPFTAARTTAGGRLEAATPATALAPRTLVLGGAAAGATPESVSQPAVPFSLESPAGAQAIVFNRLLLNRIFAVAPFGVGRALAVALLAAPAVHGHEDHDPFLAHARSHCLGVPGGHRTRQPGEP